jgi:hypothetical protein
MTSDSQFKFAISLSVLNHLGRNLYRNFVTVLGEAISNAWDADAQNVWISFDKAENVFFVKDDGLGMDADDFQNKFLKIGYSKRQDGQSNTGSGRPYIGAKGIGKLALLSCAKRITVFSKKAGSDEYVGGVIDNGGLDEAIKDDLEPDQYPLESPDFGLLNGKTDGHNQGTIIIFEGANDVLKTSEQQIRKLLALSFHFSLLDENFTIHVNGQPVGIDDLKELTDRTEFVWRLESYDEKLKALFINLKEEVAAPETDLELTGFIASVEKPSHLKIRGADERATVDLFVNGRLREKGIIRHTPKQRIAENYIYGQIHFDAMDADGDKPFTSSREGIVETDPNFIKLMEYIGDVLLPKIIDQWDALRLKYRQTGDDENDRKSVKDRKAAELVQASEGDFLPSDGDAGDKEIVEDWLKRLRDDAEYNTSSYVDCFLSENLVRAYIRERGLEVCADGKENITKYTKSEEKAKGKANISFEIRQGGDDLNFLSMNDLAETAEGSKTTDGKPSLWADAIQFSPPRNAVGHTSRLSDDAKLHLNSVFRNIKARIRNLLK